MNNEFLLHGTFHLKMSKYHQRGVSVTSYQRGGRDTERRSDCSLTARKAPALTRSDLPAAGSPSDRGIASLSLEAQVSTAVVLCYSCSDTGRETVLPSPNRDNFCGAHQRDLPITRPLGRESCSYLTSLVAALYVVYGARLTLLSN